MTEMRPVKVGIGSLEREMTLAQALRWAKANIPSDLKRAGFSASVFTSDLFLHGGLWFRINYSK